MVCLTSPALLSFGYRVRRIRSSFLLSSLFAAVTDGEPVSSILFYAVIFFILFLFEFARCDSRSARPRCSF